MRGNEFLDKMELINPVYVEAADVIPKKKKNSWVKWGAMAACLCLVIMGMVLWAQTTQKLPEGGSPIISENGVTIPPLDVSLSPDVAADMLAFFIYQGRCYVQYEWIQDENIVGEYLGTAIGLIDEWTPKEGYVELAGSVSGDFYEVKGYDSTFMLCMKEPDGVVSTYICNNGITLKYGSELYEDRLHLSGNIESVQYESNDSWYYSKGDFHQIDGVNDIILDFISDMDFAQFIPYDAVSLDQGKTSLEETGLYHLYFRLKNGTTVRLRLYENGYVRFDGMWSLCVQVSEETYGVLLDLLK